MRRVLVVCVVLSLLVPCVALAQDDGSNLRLRGGYFDLGDFDEGWGVGVDYLSDFGPRMKWGVGAEWIDVNPPNPVIVGAKGAFGVKQAWGFVGFVEYMLCEHEEFDGFLGAGTTWHTFSNAVSDDAFGGRAYVGAEFGARSEFSVQVGYDFREDVFGNWDSSGINAQVGFNRRLRY